MAHVERGECVGRRRYGVRIADTSAALDALAPKVGAQSAETITEADDQELMGAAAVAHLPALRRCRSTRVPDSDHLQTGNGTSSLRKFAHYGTSP